MKKVNLINEKFGRLVVINEQGHNNSNKILWSCLCECGNIIATTGNNLKSGNTLSCGCYNKQRVRETHFENLVGTSFGRLFVLKMGDKIGKLTWVCQCDCGSITEVLPSDLKTGKTKSCGRCIKSHGELKINDLLIENNISFVSNYKDLNCKFPNGYCAIFDFAILDLKQEVLYFIEYDGAQHFLTKERGFYTEERILNIQEHDKIKTNYCLQNSIPLIRIPFTYFNNLSFESLVLKNNIFLVRSKDGNIRY
jgi:hypothetical protein